MHNNRKIGAYLAPKPPSRDWSPPILLSLPSHQEEAGHVLEPPLDEACLTRARRVVALSLGAPSDKRRRVTRAHHMTVTFLNRKACQNSAHTLHRKFMEASASLQPRSNGHASTPMATRATHKSLLQLAAQEDRRKCTKSAENPPSPPLSIFGKSHHFDVLRIKLRSKARFSTTQLRDFAIGVYQLQTLLTTCQRLFA